ncbi:MAG: TPM domain-containing protein [bacterium]|nr:TPM domain-containing protein [bacterium]
MKKVIFYLLITSLIISQGIFAYSEERKLPKPTGYVCDFANVINTEYKNYLEKLAWNIEKKTGIEIAIVSIKSLQGEVVEEYAVALFEEWGIGKKDKDNGLLLLVAPKERKVRIEVGYGLEGILPDSLCGTIIDKDMIPYFKRGDYGQGITAAMERTTKIIEREYKTKISLNNSGVSIPHSKHSRTMGSIISTLFSLLFFMLLLGARTGLLGFLLCGLLGGGGYWRSGGYYGGSGGFSGGFGGFGGGSSGGGGASGSW